MAKLKKSRYPIKEAGQLIVNPRFIGPCLAGIFCLIVATVVGVGYLFTMAMAILALPVASYIVGSAMMRSCTSARKNRITATQDERTMAVVSITNSKGLLPTGISVTDTLPDHIAVDGDPEVEVLSPSKAEARIWLCPKKRGLHKIGPVEILAYDPLGMLRIKRRLGNKSEILVYPKPLKVGIGTPSSGFREFGATHPSGKPSVHGEFAGVREYRQGDDPKRIHWKTTARTQKLSVVACEESTVGPITVAVDLSSGSDVGSGMTTSLDVAASAAAYIIREHLLADRPVKVLLPSKDNISITNLCTPDDLEVALAALARAKADSSITAGKLISSCDHRQESVMLITSRSTKELATSIRNLSVKGTKVCVAMVDPEQFDKKRSTEAEIQELRHAGAFVEVIKKDGHV